MKASVIKKKSVIQQEFFFCVANKKFEEVWPCTKTIYIQSTSMPAPVLFLLIESFDKPRRARELNKNQKTKLSSLLIKNS